MNSEVILLVDDNPDDVELILHAMEESHIANPIEVARDGAEALDIIFGTGADQEGALDPAPTLILLDIKLPKVDGMEVLRRVREDPRTRRVPVVILTTSDEQQDKARSYDLGINSYIRKPVEFDKFVKVIADRGMYWLLLNEPPPPVDMQGD